MTKAEQPSPETGSIVENKGYNEQELLEFVGRFPHAADVMCAQSLLFKQGDKYIFPTSPTLEEEKSSAEKGDQGFRARVARHTAAVGLTMNILLESLKKNGIEIDDYTFQHATEAMILHDLKKIQEIKWRNPLGSSDKAYDAAEAHLADLLRRAGYAEEYIQLAGSIGHNGAKDFITAPLLWPLIRQCAYLADDLLQENVVQTDISAKVVRLQTDPRYQEANAAGFPDRTKHQSFVNSDGTPKRKYDIQGEATTHMAKNVAQALGVNWQDLGKFIISQACTRGVYQASFA